MGRGRASTKASYCKGFALLMTRNRATRIFPFSLTLQRSQSGALFLFGCLCGVGGGWTCVPLYCCTDVRWYGGLISFLVRARGRSF